MFWSRESFVLKLNQLAVKYIYLFVLIAVLADTFVLDNKIGKIFHLMFFSASVVYC